MELKKNPKANLEKSKALFFQAGMILALVIMLAAFEWSTAKEPANRIKDTYTDNIITEVIPQTTSESQKPSVIPPLPEPLKIEIVENTSPLENDWIPFDNTDNGNSIYNPVIWNEPAEETVDEPIPIVILEEQPKFRGGDMNTFRTFVFGEVKYPPMAQEAGVQGTVYINFVIDKSGNLVDARVVRSSGNDDLDKEALRAVKLSERWTPGKQQDKPVKVLCTIPVAFRLTN